MEIIYFKEIVSTQNYLLDNLKEDYCVWTEYQTDGIGSRGKTWNGERGNLFFSFAINKNKLPKDLPLQSSSIYFMFQLKMLLNNFGSQVKFKWPNDLYLKNKVAGIITQIKNDIIIVGIGVNTKHSINFENLDIEVDNYNLLISYLEFINKKISWNKIYESYRKEFCSNNFVTSENIDLSKAILNKDGSITINNKRMYNLR